MEKFLENLEQAEKTLKLADHMAYVTFPLVKDKKLMLKILLDIKAAEANCINALLQYDYIYKKIKLFQNPETNLKTFREKCAPRYDITPEEIASVLELFNLAKKHKNSSMEILKDEKIIILSENMNSETLTIEKTKEFLNIAKTILKKTEKVFLR